jgi:hypothetical protein
VIATEESRQDLGHQNFQRRPIIVAAVVIKPCARAFQWPKAHFHFSDVRWTKRAKKWFEVRERRRS